MRNNDDEIYLSGPDLETVAVIEEVVIEMAGMEERVESRKRGEEEVEVDTMRANTE